MNLLYLALDISCKRIHVFARFNTERNTTCRHSSTTLLPDEEASKLQIEEAA